MTSMALVQLSTSDATALVAPSLGGSVLRYDLADGTPIFRPADTETSDPFASGCFPMIPWCNRLSNGFALDAERYPIAPNRPDQALPIHGSAAQQAWAISEQSPHSVRLTLASDQPAPFRYDAVMSYELSKAALSVALTVTHRGSKPVPYGLGLHPWLPRQGTVRVQAKADEYLQTGPDLLPQAAVPLVDPSPWDFNRAKSLPVDLIDTCFAGWDGTALLRGEDGWGLDVQTQPACGWYQVYSPGSASDFFCFEPVTHPIDAHNTPGLPGLAVLEPGESTGLTVIFSPV